jgi:hypothetical protein
VPLAFPSSLEQGKKYVQLRDPRAEKHGMLRIVDESGDSHLYPKAMFRDEVSEKRAVA